MCIACGRFVATQGYYCDGCHQSLEEQQRHYDAVSNETLYDSEDFWINANEANDYWDEGE